MNKPLTLTQAEFDALPVWPEQKLPPPVVGNKWKYRLTTGWRIAGYEDRDGILYIAYYDEWEIVEPGQADG